MYFFTQLEMMSNISSVEIYVENPEHLLGIFRCCSVISKDENGDEIKDHQDLIDNTDYHSQDELIEDIAKRLNVKPEIVEIAW